MTFDEFKKLDLNSGDLISIRTNAESITKRVCFFLACHTRHLNPLYLYIPSSWPWYYIDSCNIINLNEIYRIEIIQRNTDINKFENIQKQTNESLLNTMLEISKLQGYFEYGNEANHYSPLWDLYKSARTELERRLSKAWSNEHE